MSNNVKISVAIVVLFITVVIVAVINSPSPTDSNMNAKQQVTSKPAELKPQYTATVEQYNVIDPATLGVLVHVENTGKAGGKPQCTVMAQSSNGTYSGFSIVEATNTLAPSGTYDPYVKITITKEGALYADRVSVECK